MSGLWLFAAALVMAAGLTAYVVMHRRERTTVSSRCFVAGIFAMPTSGVALDALRLIGTDPQPALHLALALTSAAGCGLLVWALYESPIELILDAVIVACCLGLLLCQAAQGVWPLHASWPGAVDVVALVVALLHFYLLIDISATMSAAERRFRGLLLIHSAVRAAAWCCFCLGSNAALGEASALAALALPASYLSVGLFVILLATASIRPTMRTARSRPNLLPYLVFALAVITTVTGLIREPMPAYPLVFVLAAFAALALVGRQLVTLSGLKKVTAQVMGRERQFHSLLSDSTDVVMISTRAGVLTYVSPSAERVLGRGAAVAGQQIWTALAMSQRAFTEALARLDGSSGDQQGSQMVEGRRDHVVLEAALSLRGGEVLVCVRDVTERDRLRQRLHFLAYHDPLTGLANRSRVLSRISSMVSHSEPCAVLFLDLDRFKQVNDNSGHSVGDQVLQQVAARLRGLVRDGDLIGRLGGDEFVAVLGVGRRAAEAAAGRLCEQLAVPFEVDGRQYQLGASVGIALASAGLLPEDLLRRADLAMYAAKRGRSSWVVYQADLAKAALAQANTDVAVSRALRDKTMDIHLQPLVDLATGRVVTVEALLRWLDDDGTVRAPVEMLDFARRSGRMAEVTSWVLQRSIDVLTASASSVSLAVNMPPELLLADALPGHLITLLELRGVSPTRLELEVTEDQLLEQAESSSTSLQRLRDLGMTVMIDDFGTGFSSLGYLVDLPIDGLKIDRRFTTALPHSEPARSIVGGLVAIATRLNLRVVAEGVETLEQHQWASRLGVHLGQGYWYARPESAQTLTDISDLGSWTTSRTTAVAPA
jgi:diguanylate cyclase (GGDEF)-like protein/PAS domain S-box-containing protein